MIRLRVPARLWDYGLVYEAKIMTRIASSYDLRTGYERVTGDTCDISEWIDFEFYDLIWYWDAPFMEANPKIGRWLGVAHRISSALCYWILKENRTVLARSTVQHVTHKDTLQDNVQNNIREYHLNLNERLKIDTKSNPTEDFERYVLHDVPGDNDNYDVYNDVSDIDNVIDDRNEDSYDGYINAELNLPDKDGTPRIGRVIKRVKGNDGKPIRPGHNNPLLDTSEYEVRLLDGSSERYSANLIAENMFSQVDTEGTRFKVLVEIVDHRSNDDAIKIKDGFI